MTARLWSAEVVAAMCDDVELLRYENWFSERGGDYRGAVRPQPRDWVKHIWDTLGGTLIGAVRKRINWVCSGGYAKGASGKKNPKHHRTATAASRKRKADRKRTVAKQTDNFNVCPVGRGPVAIPSAVAVRSALPNAKNMEAEGAVGRKHGGGRKSGPHLKRERGKRRMMRQRERTAKSVRLQTADRDELESLAMAQLWKNDYLRRCWEQTIPRRTIPDDDTASGYYVVILRRAVARAVGKAVAGENPLNPQHRNIGPQVTAAPLGDVDPTFKVRDKRERLPLWAHINNRALLRLTDTVIKGAVDSVKRETDRNRLSEVVNIVHNIIEGQPPQAELSRYRKRLRRLDSTIHKFGIDRIFDGVELPQVRTDDDVFPLAPVAVRSAPLAQPENRKGETGETVTTSDCIGAEHIRTSAIFAKRSNEPLWLTLRTCNVQFANYRPVKVSQADRDKGYCSPLVACSAMATTLRCGVMRMERVAVEPATAEDTAAYERERTAFLDRKRTQVVR